MSFAPYLFTNSQDPQEMMVNPNIKNAIEELKWGLLEWLTISIYDHKKKIKKKIWQNNNWMVFTIHEPKIVPSGLIQSKK